ncbi:hypothetical protein HRI_000473700 [Hibiscus trionum]|uniref:DUF4216 domain-containing protein n=1 Tax=Hibiscus trionum TaxID=183268 RepID=A0A9W7LKV3_HIBTR|nr:hypothetical protein HRI_000473700 [Hibiscus trionum]
MSKTWSYANARDKQPVEGKVNYYGGCKKDKFDFTLVNFSHLAHRGNNLVDEPFVLASQVKKVYFVKDETQPNWKIVKHAKLRDVFDMGGASSFEKDEALGQLVLDDSIDTSASSWIRNDVGAIGLDVTTYMKNENIEEDPINEENGEDIF